MLPNSIPVLNFEVEIKLFKENRSFKSDSFVSKVVKKTGATGGTYLPKSWIGKRIVVFTMIEEE